MFDLDDIADVFQNIITFGAKGRLDDAVHEYNRIRRKFENLSEEHDKRKSEVNGIIQELGKQYESVIQNLRKLRNIYDRINVEDRKVLDKELVSQNYELSKIDYSISAGEQIINTAKGAIGGASTALGAWALVGTYGVASTGTAIGTLSGAAATNATLAWLGGGSLAAGGAGMAGGALVLGGLFAIPTLAITGIFSHLSANKKITEIKKEESEILSYIDKIKKNMLQFDIIEANGKERISSLKKLIQAFNVQYENTYNEIFPHGRNTKSKLSKSEQKELQRLCIDAGNILEILEAPLISERSSNNSPSPCLRQRIRSTLISERSTND